VRIANIHGTAKTAFGVEAYPTLPLEHFMLSDLHLQTQTAGYIADASDWSFTGLSLSVTDGSKVALSDSRSVTGIETVPAPSRSTATPPGSFAEQDKK
jgi:hypothetical protein